MCLVDGSLHHSLKPSFEENDGIFDCNVAGCFSDTLAVLLVWFSSI